MSLWPITTSNFWDYSRPSRLPDQQFGLILNPEDFVTPLVRRPHINDLNRFIYNNGLLGDPYYYNRLWRSLASNNDSGSMVSFDQDQFQAQLDVQQFKPDEIKVTVSNDESTVTIEGRHDEKQDEHGYISRHFVRKYVLPKGGHDVSKIESKLSSDGVLTITAPRRDNTGHVANGHRIIPIVPTGQPADAVDSAGTDQKKDDKENK